MDTLRESFDYVPQLLKAGLHGAEGFFLVGRSLNYRGEFAVLHSEQRLLLHRRWAEAVKDGKNFEPHGGCRYWHN